jgi:peptidoglycan/LPS O-acetylase OafA/YrhL
VEHRPALDGLRAVAILMVLFAHTDLVAAVPYGLAGVAVFFALSGFLITSLLLAEHGRRGRVDLRAFFVRRGARLLPALLVLLGVLVAVDLVVRPGPWFLPSRDVWGTLFYYSDLLHFTEARGALAHTWSLAVEEQFYLTWPLLFVALASRRRALVATTAALALASLVARELVWDPYDPFRVMFGPDVQAVTLLLGCLLALCLGGRRLSGRWVTPALLAIVLVVPALGSGFMDRTGVPVVSALTCVVVAGCAADRRPVLTSAPLVWLGRRSYAVYLYHYPLVAVLQRLHVAGLPRLVIVLPVVLGLAALSWRYVEQPARRWVRDRAQGTAPALPPCPVEAVLAT